MLVPIPGLKWAAILCLACHARWLSPSQQQYFSLSVFGTAGAAEQYLRYLSVILGTFCVKLP